MADDPKEVSDDIEDSEQDAEQLLSKIKESDPEINEIFEQDPALEGVLLNDRKALKTLFVRLSKTEIKIGGQFSALDLVRLNKENPGYIDKHTQLVEKDQDNTYNLRKTAMLYTFTERFGGLVFAFIIVMTSFIAGLYSVFNGHEEFGYVLVGVDLAGVAGLFIKRTFYSDKNLRKDKSPEE